MATVGRRRHDGDHTGDAQAGDFWYNDNGFWVFMDPGGTIMQLDSNYEVEVFDDGTITVVPDIVTPTYNGSLNRGTWT